MGHSVAEISGDVGMSDERPKRSKPKVVRLRKAKVDETRLVETLVWLLDRARAGKVTGYAMVYVVEDEAGFRDYTEGADTNDGERQRLMMLGAMRMMERNFIKREWPEIDSQ